MRVICLFGAAFLFLSACLGAETLTLTRDKAVALALERNERFQKVKLEANRVRGQFIEARAGAFPQLSLSANYTRTIDLQTSFLTMSTEDESDGEEGFGNGRIKLEFGTPHSYQFGLSLYQPLYAPGVGSAIQIAKYGYVYTDERIKAARHDISTEADKAYLDAIAAREAAFVYREAQALADSNLAVVRRLFDQGRASEYDLLRAQVRAANARPDRIAAENAQRLALDALRVMLSLPATTDLVLQEDIDIIDTPEAELAPLIDEAFRQRPEIQQSEQMIKIREKNINIERRGVLPNLGVRGGVSWDKFLDDFKSPLGDEDWNRSSNVMVTFTWNIFDGFYTKGRIKQAQVDLHQSRLDDNQLRNTVRLEVRDAYGNAREASQRVAALGETVDQAQRGVEIAQVRYQNGVGTQLEVLDAQVALTRARVNRITAIHDLAVAVAELRRAVGRDWAPQW